MLVEPTAVMASTQGSAGGESEKEKPLFQSKTKMKDDIKVLSDEVSHDGRFYLQAMPNTGTSAPGITFPSHSACSGDNLVSLSPFQHQVPALIAQTTSKPDHKIIHVSPDTRHFGPEAAGIQQQTANVTQQEIGIIRRDLSGQWAHITAELPLHGVESTLKANAVQSPGNSAGVADPLVRIQIQQSSNAVQRIVEGEAGGLVVQMEMQNSTNQQVCNTGIQPMASGQSRPRQLQHLLNFQQFQKLLYIEQQRLCSKANALPNTATRAGVACCVMQTQMQKSANQQPLNAAVRPMASDHLRPRHLLNFQQSQQVRHHKPPKRHNKKGEENAGISETHADYLPPVKITRKDPDPAVAVSHLPLAAVADRPIVSAKMKTQEQRFAFLKKKKEKKMQKKIQKKLEKKKAEEAAEAAIRILIRNHYGRNDYDLYGDNDDLMTKWV